MTRIIQPSVKQKSFNCPRCGVLCPQTWYVVSKNSNGQSAVSLIDTTPVAQSDERPMVRVSRNPDDKPVKHRVEWDLRVSVCADCDKYTIWENRDMIFPLIHQMPRPSADMPEESKKVYQEACLVFKNSPRAAAALLRLAIEMMIIEILGHKKKLNTMIQELVDQGIPDYVQKGLDMIRHFGNEGIHPGEIDLNDDQETVMFLFELINIMVEELISRKKKIEAFYAKLPEVVVKGINQRGGTKTQETKG